MERSTPAAVLLDKKKLALTGSQVAFLTGLRKITADSNARNEWARTEAAKVLTEAQLPRAKDYWADEEEQDQKWFRPRGRSGGGGGGRRPLGV